ncbi:hypothetical protein ABZS66_39640 [Dactylosporangium sp. NPDC005572]|uniref:hypothetical protein n=1 Tax=Dactylosporangium sp. NPDC005572 TaxID=3156889 RepID=UPI0033AA035D
MPTMLATVTAVTSEARSRPSTDVPVPHDVTDVLLWRLAFDVAVEHQRNPVGDCTNLRCAGQRGACGPALQAQWALQMARRPATPAPPRMVAAPPGAAPVTVTPTRGHAHPTVGRAAVSRPSNGRFTGWFTSTTAVVNQWRPHHQLPNRTSGAALAAA